MPIPEFLQTIRAGFGPGYLLLPAVAMVVRDDAGRVLVMRRADTGEWSLPSGICEPGEPPARTAARELWEEAGLRGVPERLLALFVTPPIDYPNGDQAGYVSTLFSMRVVGGELACRDGEALELRYVHHHELPPIQLLDWLPASLPELLAQDGPGAAFTWDNAWLDELHP